MNGKEGVMEIIWATPPLAERARRLNLLPKIWSGVYSEYTCLVLNSLRINVIKLDFRALHLCMVGFETN
jgi:hypothetical protein